MNRLDNKPLQERIGYTYKDEKLLFQALTHTSYANELGKGKHKSYERIEFLGDAVLEMISSEYFYHTYPDQPEGSLTKMRAASVCEQALAITARDIGLGEHILFGRGEENTGGRQRESILADVVEALIGSIYLDGGIDAAKDFIMKFVLNDLDRKQLFYDAKSILQERVQKDPNAVLSYRLVSESGPEHEKEFVCEALVGDKVIGRGSGHSKKQAQQQAAYEALRSQEFI
ncbi:MAG: ribonuclease III [Lachnospiraceae bacterium]|nr:ribonuclease III [Lachnospiraceae bacterium]